MYSTDPKFDEQPFGPVTVPAGHLWVMGDHRDESADSRAHINDADQGTIPVDNVIGKAFVIIWPVSRWTTLGTPSDFGGDGQRAPYTLPLLIGIPLILVARGRRDGHDEATAPRPLSTLSGAMTDPLRPPRAPGAPGRRAVGAARARCAAAASRWSPVPTRPAAEPAPARWWWPRASCPTASAARCPTSTTPSC